MKQKTIIRSILLVFALGSLAVWGTREYQKSQAISEAATTSRAEEVLPVVPGNQVVMTYFRNSIRCASCRKIEAHTTETAQKDFAEELASGKLVLRVIDVDQPENHHFIEDYQLTSKAVILNFRVDGEKKNWSDMDKVWDLLDEPEAFRAYLAEPIREHLGL